MIEQIINWCNNANDFQVIGIVTILIVVVILLSVYFQNIRPYLKNKRKTTTQKYKEGLIKK